LSGYGFTRVTAAGEGAVATFELFGRDAGAALETLFRPRGGRWPSAGEIRVGDLVDPDGGAIDEATLARVAGGAGWSGLETWRLSIHGGLWLQGRVAELLIALGGRALSLCDVLAMAVEAGALDAAQAAAYALLVEARTDRAARFFARQHAGELSARVAECLRLCERGAVSDLRALLEGLLAHSREALRLASPARIVLAGRPNAGKSTLFNRLVGEERAVVTPVPGTTRDLIEGDTSLDDYPVTLVDSAGIREPNAVGAVEREGLRRVVEGRFDGVLYLIPPPWQPDSGDEAFLRSLTSDGRLVVGSMADLPGDRPVREGRLYVSARSGEGIEPLRRAIVRAWIDRRDDPREEVPCAPFTPRLRALFRRALSAAEETGSAALDAARSALVESLRPAGNKELDVEPGAPGRGKEIRRNDQGFLEREPGFG
jgi:tRNA modification GTPase